MSRSSQYTMKEEHLSPNLSLNYGKTKLLVKRDETYVFYATYIAEVYSSLNIHKGDIVIDAGANVGDFTVKAGRLTGSQGMVIAIEPSPSNIEMIKKNAEINHLHNIILRQYALSDVTGSAYLTGYGVGSTIMENGNDDQTCKTTTIDEILSEVKTSADVVIKMDIEGAEELVFKNYDFLDRTREITLELHGERNVINIPEILKKKGFDVKFLGVYEIVRNTLRNTLIHPVSFINVEVKTNFTAIRSLFSTLSKDPDSIISMHTEKRATIHAKRI